MDFKFIKRMANIARQDGKMKTITLQVEDGANDVDLRDLV